MRCEIHSAWSAAHDRAAPVIGQNHWCSHRNRLAAAV